MITALLLLALAAPNPVAWKLSAVPARPVKPGATLTVKLVASIEAGWHIYWLKQVPDGPVATRIALPDGQPFRLAGRVQAPEPEIVQDPSFGMEVGHYAGETVFTLPLRVVPEAAAGEHKLTVSATYQTCNNKVCLPPRTIQASIPVAVKR
jgi:DsbC/DsbD-like thiol-disulfide interchange protein